MDELVSIVVPMLNREDTLPRLLRSLKAVTYPNVEIIFVDNGSSDRSVELCKDFGGTVLCCDKPGASSARNVGLQAAKGKYVSFFDSDDEMSPSFVADLVDVMEAEGAELAVARTRMVWPDGREHVRERGGRSVEAHIIAQGLNTASWVARTDLLRRIGGWDESLRYWDDYEIGVRLLIGSRRTVWSDNVYHRTYEYDGPRLTTTSGQARADRSLQALQAIRNDVVEPMHVGAYGSVAYSLSRSLRALQLRCAIVRGQLERDGLDGSQLECNGFLPNLLRVYTRLGGRGAWRMAMSII